MPKTDKYHLNYEKLYPDAELTPEILSVLKKTDRKMQYIEVDLKSERFIYSQKEKTAVFLPSREDSFERIEEEGYQQFASDEDSPEETALRRIEYERLHQCITQLPEDDQVLLYLRFWKNKSQSELSALLSITQQTVSYREKKILRKLKKLLEN